MSESLATRWQRRFEKLPFRDRVSFEDNDLFLGLGTVLYKVDVQSPRAISLRPDAAYDRMIALLAVAGKGRLAKAALSQLDAALHDWRRGDRGLAAIRLAFARLPRLQSREEAHHLFLAETALDAGLPPNDLLKELGYSACAPLLKYDPDQPRVPAGSGERSGRWTSGDASGAEDSSGSVSFVPEDAGTARLIPALSPVGSETQENTFVDDWWRLEIGGREKERIEEGKPLLPPTIAPGAQAAPPSGSAPSGGAASLATPAPAMGPAPVPLPGGLGGANPTQSGSVKGPACPAAQNDRPNGPNPSGDEFEYQMSLLINPNNPTPKYSASTPNVTSQAYYLPSPAPDGKTSFDDCKKDNTPMVLNIPNLKPGDMFEIKALGWSGLLSNSNTRGYQTFRAQVEDQNAAVVTEGRGRQIYYCMGNQNAANLAAKAFNKFSNSHFLVCH